MNNGNIMGVNIDKTPLKPVHDVSNGLMAIMPVAFLLLGIASVGFGAWQLAVGIPKHVKQELVEEYDLEQRVLRAQSNGTPANAENSENGVRFDGIYQYSAAGASKPERFLRFFKDRTVIHARSSESALRVYVQSKKKKDGKHTAGLSAADFKFEDSKIVFTDNFSNLGLISSVGNYSGAVATSGKVIVFDVREQTTYNGKTTNVAESREYAFVEIPN